MISEFNEWFDADYASTSSRNINQSFAHDELCNDRPIIGAYSYAGYGHAVVICGVNENLVPMHLWTRQLEIIVLA